MSKYNYQIHKIGAYISKYRIQYLIAGGTFGKVYMASHLSKKYAIKEMTEPTKSLARQQMENQIKVLAELNHQNIVKLYQVIRQNGYVYLVMEYCQSDMRQLIGQRQSGFSEQQAFTILRQIVDGMNQLLKLHIVHRDLKPANILYSKGIFKIADFGLAKFIQDECQMLKTRVGTPFYMAPQILKNQKYTSKCDIWSLGVIFYQLMFGSLPWYATSQQDLIYNICNVPLKLPKNSSQRVRKLLQKMIAVQEFQRFSWDELLKQLNNKTNDFQLQKSYHKTTMEKLVQIQLNRVSVASYSRIFELLKSEQKKSVAGLISKFFNEENRQTINFFIKSKMK